MRKDMGKVITERPRRGMRTKAPKGEKKQLQQGLEELPKSEKIRQKWQSGWNGKEFTDVLGPLVGFLKKNCGRPWDKVLSEVNAVLPASGGVSYSHARDHLFQMVEEKTQKIDGVLCDTKGQPLGNKKLSFGDWTRDFYVDPQGILRAWSRGTHWWSEWKGSGRYASTTRTWRPWMRAWTAWSGACISFIVPPTGLASGTGWESPG